MNFIDISTLLTNSWLEKTSTNWLFIGWVLIKWSISDSNRWPLRCQRSALANWANAQYNYCLPLRINSGIEQWNSDFNMVFFSQSFWKKPLLRLNTHNKSGLLDWKCSKTPWKVVTFSEVEILFWMAFREASTIKSSSLYSGVFTNSKLILVLKRLFIS